jgi:hypothetical protein
MKKAVLCVLVILMLVLTTNAAVLATAGGSGASCVRQLFGTHNPMCSLYCDVCTWEYLGYTETTVTNCQRVGMGCGWTM